MAPQDQTLREKMWQEAVKFHGHSCPGLAIGARIALDFREDAGLSDRAEDEEIVALVETDACGVDGIQVILGCTAGKGNLWLQKRGKHVFTLFQRGAENVGRRYVWTASGRDGQAREDQTREDRIAFFLNAPKDQLYKVEAPRYPLPPEAAIYPPADCATCGERTAEPQLRVREGKMVCLDCAGEPMTFSSRIIL
ncbi:FmdE family protein [Desulfosarcina sp. OttesenSCG-928-G17]|nr:FmdE family protein [Desulfosarcina sp. OttesenSCG-928-G17]